MSLRAILGRISRYPLRLLPADLAVPVLQGPLHGNKWIVGSARHACWLGTYEHEKQKLIASELKPGSVFYDVGAQAGFYSVLASRLVGQGRVYAFEPLPQNVRFLRRHLELNRIENVAVFELAISDRVGWSMFEEAADRAMGRVADEGNLRVRTASLDSLLAEKKIAPPHLIKMDIEGGELVALRGALEIFRRFRPVLYLATHGREVYAECRLLLESWGYECRLLGRTTGQDRAEVVAKFRG